MAESTAPAPPGPDARDRLLIAAEEIFAEKGFDSATIRQISLRAEVNIASINYYFGDKERLYVEALRRAHECADGGPAGQLPEWPAGVPAVDKLRGFIQFMVSRMHAPARPSAMRLLMREFAHPSPAAQAVILLYIRPKAFLLRAVLEELLPDADPQRLLMIGFSVIGQILFYRQNRPVVELIFGKDQVDALDPVAVTNHITRFTLAALGLEPSYSAGPAARADLADDRGALDANPSSPAGRSPA